MIYVIATSANIDDDYQSRKAQYLKGLSSILEYYKINPYIIETYKQTDYLAEHYTGNSMYSANKGINEFINIESFFKNTHLKFDDDDIIIKTTLRYEIISSVLVDKIKESNHDVYCKSSSDIYGPGDTGVHCFLFAMKYKCWKEFLNLLDKTVHEIDPVERQLSAYFKTVDTKYLNNLGILANPRNHNKIYKV
jgi:hypothetical protein